MVASAIDFNSARGQKEIKDHLLCLKGVTNKTFHIHWFSHDSSDRSKTEDNVQSGATTACPQADSCHPFRDIAQKH